MDNIEVYKKLQEMVRRLELEINSDETKIREMEKSFVDMPPEMQEIGRRIKSSNTVEELEVIRSEIDYKISDFKTRYNDLLISIGIDPATL